MQPINTVITELEREREELDTTIRLLKRRLSGAGAAETASPTPSPTLSTLDSRPSKLSAAARKRISQAQKKRWAEIRKRNKG